jgi:sialate O-acetylesterase
MSDNWRTLGLTVALLGPLCAHADVQLAPIFSDNMVLQRNAPIRFWGTATDGERVEVSLGEDSAQTITRDGKWGVALPARKAGGPSQLVVRSGNTVTIRNVLIGDVWLCTGQSNMVQKLARTTTPAETLSVFAQDLRLYSVPNPRQRGFSDLRPTWTLANRKSANMFSGVCYLFGARLQEELQIPIGLIAAAVGGTPIQTWLPVDRAEKNLPTRDALSVDKAIGQSQLFHSMIHPLTSYPIRGVAWYQGEANRNQARSYEILLKELVRGWRTAWTDETLPFLIVQLSSFGKAKDFQEISRWAELRDVQRRVADDLSNVALIVSADVGNGDVHPPDKLSVARRLADAALGLTYAMPDRYRMPKVASVARSQNGVSVTFSADQECLRASGSLNEAFYLKDETGRWSPARASLEGSTLRLTSPAVRRPKMLRYGWSDNPPLAIFGCGGVPGSPFEISIP